MHSKAERKEAIRQFRERKTTRGIFAVRCTTTGAAWVGASPNLEATRNGLFFMLRNGSHIDKTIQTHWNQQGEAAFAFEVLEELADDIADMNLRDMLKAKRDQWAAQLGAKVLL